MHNCKIANGMALLYLRYNVQWFNVSTVSAFATNLFISMLLCSNNLLEFAFNIYWLSVETAHTKRDDDTRPLIHFSICSSLIHSFIHSQQIHMRVDCALTILFNVVWWELYLETIQWHDTQYEISKHNPIWSMRQRHKHQIKIK